MPRNVSTFQVIQNDCFLWRSALVPIVNLVFIALILPSIIWSYAISSPRMQSPSLQEFANRSDPAEIDALRKNSHLEPLRLSASAIRFQELPLGQFFHTDAPVRVTSKFDYRNVVPWVASRSKSYKGLPPISIDDFLYHSESPLGVSLNSGTFADITKFTIDQNRSLRAYFGILHGHTESSDGKGLPSEAFVTGRDIAKLDFFSLTDHSEAWRVKGGPKGTPWREVQELAAQNTTDSFIGFAGFEYSSMPFGHFTVLNTKNYRDSVLDYSLWDFYSWLAAPEQSDAIVFFNHPGFHIYRRPFEFMHLDYAPKLSETIVGMEVLHRNSAYEYMRGYSQVIPYLDEAVLKGWHLGSVGGQDNHRASWGLQDSVRIAPLMGALTRTNLIEALKKRRFYATQVQDLQFTVEVKAHHSPWYPMGSRIPKSEVDHRPMQVRVAFADPTGNEVPRRLEIVSAGEIVGKYEFSSEEQVKLRRPPFQSLVTPEERQAQERANHSILYSEIDPTKLRGYGVPPKFYPRAGEWRFELDTANLKRGSYFYVRFYQGDEADVFTQSSPIWIE